MRLYDYYRSSASYRVRIALNIKDISYERLAVNLIHDGGEQHYVNYIDINPQSLVPTLDENGHILSQSLAIIEYLDEMNPAPPLLPQTPLAKGLVRSMAFIIACDIHPLNNLRVLNQLRLQFSASDDQVCQWYHLWLKSGFDAFEKQLQQIPRKKSVCYGQEITIADLCLIPQVYNAERFNFPMNDYPLIKEINDYCLTLPAFYEASPEASNL